MNESLERLFEVCPPPSKPNQPPTKSDWDRIESQIAISFPDDYKQILEKYGHGTWQGFWYFFNPAVHDDANWFSPEGETTGKLTLPILRAVRESDREEGVHDAEFAIFPETGGMLPWASTDNGGVFCWLTKGSQSNWPTVYFDEDPWRCVEKTVYELSCSEILLGAVTGELPIFEDEFGGADPELDEAFEPAE